MQTSRHYENDVIAFPNVGFYYTFANSDDCANICTINQAMAHIEGHETTIEIDFTKRLLIEQRVYYTYKTTDPGCYFIRPKV